MMDFQEIAYTASIWVIPVLLAVTLHEAAHGWVAWRLGDDTAYRLGRVTLNPLRHVDPFGTLLMPALLLFASGGKFMFGYAKPVPVNFWRLSRFHMVLVAAAGPATLSVLTAYVYVDTAEPLRSAGVTMCAIFLVGLAVLPFAPETKGQPLPE